MDSAGENEGDKEKEEEGQGRLAAAGAGASGRVAFAFVAGSLGGLTPSLVSLLGVGIGPKGLRLLLFRRAFRGLALFVRLGTRGAARWVFGSLGFVHAIRAEPKVRQRPTALLEGARRGAAWVACGSAQPGVTEQGVAIGVIAAGIPGEGLAER